MKASCSCGREFTTHSGMANHAKKCVVEIARVAAYVKAIEEGRTIS